MSVMQAFVLCTAAQCSAGCCRFARALPHTSRAVWAPRLTTAHRPLPCLQAPANPLEPVVGGALGDGDVLMTLNSDCFGLVRGY